MPIQYQYYLMIITVSAITYWGWKEKEKINCNQALIFMMVTIAALYFSLFSANREIGTLYSEYHKKITIVGGIDTSWYISQFKIANQFSLPVFLVLEHGEPGFRAVVWLLRQFTDDYRIMFFLFYEISYLLIFVFITKQDEIKPSYVYCLLLMSPLVEMNNLLRMGIVIPIAMLALQRIKEGKYQSSFIVILFGALFQYSALIVLVVWAISFADNRIRGNYGLTTMILLSTLLVGGAFAVLIFFAIKFIIPGTEYNIYLIDAGASRSYFFFAYLIILSILNKDKLLDIIPSYRYYIYVLVTALVCFIGQLGFSLMYRFLTVLLPVIYLYTLILIHKIYVEKGSTFLSIKVSLSSFFNAAILSVYLIYRVYAMFAYVSGLI